MATRSIATKKVVTRKSAVAPARLLRTVLDASVKTRDRLTALSLLDVNDVADRAMFRSVVALLRDPEVEGRVRNAVLSTLQSAAFDPVAFSPYRSMYLVNLRALRQDLDPEIRQRAFGILARENDPDTQAMLLNGLNKPDEALLPPEKALQLLSYDVHAGAFDIARRIADSPPNALARREALRVLAADAQSVNRFENILRDKIEDLPIRQLAASALNQLAPQLLQSCARDIAVDERESSEMTALSLAALSHFGDPISLKKDNYLQDHVDTLTQRSNEAEGTVQLAAQEFMSRQGR